MLDKTNLLIPTIFLMVSFLVIIIMFIKNHPNKKTICITLIFQLIIGSVFNFIYLIFGFLLQPFILYILIIHSISTLIISLLLYKFALTHFIDTTLNNKQKLYCFGITIGFSLILALLGMLEESDFLALFVSAMQQTSYIASLSLLDEPLIISFLKIFGLFLIENLIKTSIVIFSKNNTE